MSTRQVLETHLSKAKQSLDERQKLLGGRKLDAKQTKRDVGVRQLQAVVRKYTHRLKALDKVAATLVDLETRRVERAAKALEPKVKKKRVVAKPVKGGGAAKKEKKAAAT